MERKTFRTGEPVTAQFMTEMANAVADAEENSNIAMVNSGKVLAKVDGAFDMASEVKEKADRGEFNGSTGVGISRAELVGTRVEGDQTVSTVHIHYTNGAVNVLEIPVQNSLGCATITSITVTKVS